MHPAIPYVAAHCDRATAHKMRWVCLAYSYHESLLEEALQSLLATAETSVLRRRRLLVWQCIELLRLLEEPMQLLARHLLLLLLLRGQYRRLVQPRLVVSHAAQRARGVTAADGGVLLMVQRLLVELLVALLRLELQVVLLLLELCQLGLLLLLTQVILLRLLGVLRRLRVVHVLERHLRRHRRLLTVPAAVLERVLLLQLLHVDQGRLRLSHACDALLGIREAGHPTGGEAARAARLRRRPAA